VTLYLLDTNVLSEVRKGKHASPSVIHWFESKLEEQLFTSVLVLGEIRNGIERIRLRDRAQAERLESWLAETTADFGERALPVTLEISDAWGRLAPARPLPAMDALLVATSIVHGLTFVTRNTADVLNLGAKLLNPFLPQ
jgi:toxin FitB